MDGPASNSRFIEFNLDPALAETVEAVPGDQIVEGIVRLEDPSEIPPQFTVVCQFNRICTGRFLAEDAVALRRHRNVMSLKAARPLGVFHEEGEAFAEIPRGAPAPFGGRGCIVAALDFGLDFAHPNFVNPDGTTRLVMFWHQGAPYDAAHPNRYGYGRIFSREEINDALRTSDPYRALGYHPAISDTGSGSHGTHTLDIAAGNGRVGVPGAGSRADLMFIHLSTPRLDMAGDLGDSVRMLEALDGVERTANGRPWVVNLSVGRTAGSHDGTSPVEQGMHELLRRGPGRAIVQSAGNYRSANLAVEGWLHDGERRDLQWIIDPADTTDNEIDIWYSGKDRFVIAIRPPLGSAFVEVKLGEVADIVHEGSIVGRIYHRRNDPNNRDNHGEVFLYSGAPSGTWTLRLIGDYVISGRFHSWIERDLARPGAQSRFDSMITSRPYTLGTIATSPLVITVGAYDANADDTPLAPFSSCGPTRDERRDKPELLAPGVAVVAARSIPRNALQQEGLLVARSGTSMAAPHVTGTVAAMFEAAGRPVSIDEIRNCLRRSALPVQDPELIECWGRLDTEGAIRAIRGSQDAIPFEYAISEALTEDSADTSDEQFVEVPVGEGGSMSSDNAEYMLDRAERALQGGNLERRDSETSFLQVLLRDLGAPVYGAGHSPARLFRAAVRGGSFMQGVQNVLRVVALPSTRPDDTLRVGDWIVRAIPGTGDVGHVSVLTSDDLLTPSVLRAEGIAAESMQSGFYGTVIEGGAFPHTRDEPFARRVLDGRGRVPPNTVILRPRGEALPTSDDVILPAGFSGERNSASAVVDSGEMEETDRPTGFEGERRSAPTSGIVSEFEDSEAFTFEPTAGLTDFTPAQLKAWHVKIEATFQAKIDRAARVILAGKVGSDLADAKKHLRFFSPASQPPTIALTATSVRWRAIPFRGRTLTPALYKAFDEPVDQLDRYNTGIVRKLRPQDEYCEWCVFRDKSNKIVRVVFTCEPPEYYDFLYNPPDPSLTTDARKKLVDVYKDRCGSTAITLSDLEITIAGVTIYDHANKWNNEHCVHLQQPDNTLGAQVDIAARGSVVRKDPKGALITDIKKLISCDPFGVAARQSDPNIGDGVNALARQNQFLTLENPVGLYMTVLDTKGWKTPDGTDPQSFWKELKGKRDKDRSKSMIVRAEYSVPASKKYTVSDILIAGSTPIDFGSQIAEHVHMRVGVSFGPKDKDLKGGKLAPPTPVVC